MPQEMADPGLHLGDQRMITGQLRQKTAPVTIETAVSRPDGCTLLTDSQHDNHRAAHYLTGIVFSGKPD